MKQILVIIFLLILIIPILIAEEDDFFVNVNTDQLSSSLKTILIYNKQQRVGFYEFSLEGNELNFTDVGEYNLAGTSILIPPYKELTSLEEYYLPIHFSANENPIIGRYRIELIVKEDGDIILTKPIIVNIGQNYFIKESILGEVNNARNFLPILGIGLAFLALLTVAIFFFFGRKY